jgi:broad specificity phosphatase PhoE
MLDDIACGVFEGGAVELDHAWRNARSRNARPPGGESLVDATQRVAAALRRILARPEPVIVVVAHELALRYLLNGARGRSGPSRPVITVPNATVYLFSPAEMALAVACIESALASAWADQAPGADGNGG